MRIFVLATVTWLGLNGAAQAQRVPYEEKPKLLSAETPPNKRQLDQRESLYHFVEGLQLEHEERYSDALKAFEKAARLDPDASAVVRAQIPILLGMNRFSDALNACKKVVAAEPDDFSTWYVQAKLLKTLLRHAEAIEALESGIKSAALKVHPEAAQGFYFELGSLYENADKFGPAADAFNNAALILEHPDLIMARGRFPREAILARAADTYEKISHLYRKAKRYDDARAALKKAQKHDPERAGALAFVSSQICLEQGDLKAALVHIDAYLETRPLSIDPFDLKVDLLRRLKQPERILPWLEQAAEREPFNSALQLLLAKEFAAARQPKNAERIYKKLVEGSPSSEHYRGLFRIYMDEGEAGMKRVLAMLDKVMEKAAKDDGPVPLGTLVHGRAMTAALREDVEVTQKLVEVAYKSRAGQDDLKVDTVYFLAILADRHRKLDEAEAFYRRCLRDATAENEAPIYNGLLRVLSRARKHQAVVDLCEHGLKNAKTTNRLLFYSDLARAQASLKRHDEALKTAANGLTQAGEDSKLVFKVLRVRILAMAERYADAESECQALIKSHARPAEAIELHYLLSSVYSAAKEQAKAEAELQQILKIDPNNPTANNDLGYLWADQGRNLETAEEMIRKALDVERSQRRRSPTFVPQTDKDNAAFVDSLGWVLYRRGQIEEARKELERAAKLDDGEDPVIFDHLGDVYHRLKMRGEASSAWQRALELYQTGIRGKEDQRVREIQRKLKQVKEEIGAR